jgi:hypothetical protein
MRRRVSPGQDHAVTCNAHSAARGTLLRNHQRCWRAVQGRCEICFRDPGTLSCCADPRRPLQMACLGDGGDILPQRCRVPSRCRHLNPPAARTCARSHAATAGSAACCGDREELYEQVRTTPDAPVCGVVCMGAWARRRWLPGTLSLIRRAVGVGSEESSGTPARAECGPIRTGNYSVPMLA